MIRVIRQYGFDYDKPTFHVSVGRKIGGIISITCMLHELANAIAEIKLIIGYEGTEILPLPEGISSYYVDFDGNKIEPNG